MAMSISFSILGAVLLTASLQTNALPQKIGDECFRPCFKNYKPVCGTDGVTQRTFLNECGFINYARCVVPSKVYWIAHQGRCNGSSEQPPVTPKQCPLCYKTYRPICSFDGHTVQTFPNECEMEVENCEKLRNFRKILDVSCEQAQTDAIKERRCKPCPKIYGPVCGQEGPYKATFSNQCVMENFDCVYLQDYKVLHNGEC